MLWGEICKPFFWRSNNIFMEFSDETFVYMEFSDETFV